MSFSEQPPSKQWAALRYRGDPLAEVWFKPDGDPFALILRIPKTSFEIPGIAERLTMENLLRGVGVPQEEVESWQRGDQSPGGSEESGPDFGQAFAAPPEDESHLTIHVRLKPPFPIDTPKEGTDSKFNLTIWQDLETRWKNIQGLEVAMDGLRVRMEGLRAELEGALKKSLTTEEKSNALNLDVAQWNKVKNRVHYALPKVKEFIHRATWAVGTPERKRLEELFKNNTGPPEDASEMDKLPDLLHNLMKDRQVLTGNGMTVYQECKSIAAEIQGALRILQSNAAVNAQKKRGAAKNS